MVDKCSLIKGVKKPEEKKAKTKEEKNAEHAEIVGAVVAFPPALAAGSAAMVSAIEILGASSITPLIGLTVFPLIGGLFIGGPLIIAGAWAGHKIYKVCQKRNNKDCKPDFR
ncbi:hypothetical protein [Cardinium endosymbiont of Nabis limbatus]|uniref:hypothetical protein n=1 Tax=Cardinium endosymbiont of Nabis limbatus TaxID=3066217 RepID=UPI003AF3327A